MGQFSCASYVVRTPIWGNISTRGVTGYFYYAIAVLLFIDLILFSYLKLKETTIGE
jgi:hypothetical protein